MWCELCQRISKFPPAARRCSHRCAQRRPCRCCHRACGLVVPVFELPEGARAADVAPGTQALAEALAEALAAGARAYLLKTVHGAEISDVVRAVASGRVLLDERTVTRRRADHDDPTADLTNAERKVLDLIGDGLSNREIGERLGVAEKTVKNHITSLLAKMGLQRRTQVAAWVAGQRASGWRNS